MKLSRRGLFTGLVALALTMPASILSAQIEQPQENTKTRDSRYYVYVKGIT